MCSVIFVSKPPDNTVTPYLLQYFYTSAISHGYLTQPWISFIQAHHLSTLRWESPDVGPRGSERHHLRLKYCGSSHGLSNTKTWPMLRMRPSCGRLSDDCANTSVIENKKTFPIRYDRQNVSRKKGNKKHCEALLFLTTSQQKLKSETSNFHGIFFSGNSKFVTRIALISIGSVMSLRCKFQQRAFNLSRRNREETSGQIMVLGCFQK